MFGGEDESAHLHPKNVLGVMALEESPLGGLALQQVCAHSHLPAGDVRPEALAYPSEREVSTLRGTAEVVCQETCSVPNELTTKFDSRMELSTYRGQRSQVELPLDFQLENNKDGGAFSRAGPAVVQQENMPLLSSASGKTQWETQKSPVLFESLNHSERTLCLGERTRNSTRSICFHCSAWRKLKAVTD